jgi:DNA-binding response OmpR family regulator
MAVSENVLLIDDEPGLRLTFTGILQDAGYAVTTAASGPEALDHLARCEFTLVYLDLRMPGMDGLAVLKEIHSRHPQLPVILVTAHATLQSALEALRLGATDYLLKPVRADTLLARTRAVLAERAVQRRRREIRAQMEALQSELRTLEGQASRQSPAGDGETSRSASNGRYLRCGALVIDLHSRRVMLGERTFTLAPTTFDYLVALARHAPELVSYETLVAEAQGYPVDTRQAQELARWHIHKLREALEPDPRHPQYVLTVWGTGYRLVAD